jgi:hypothetical protein
MGGSREVPEPAAMPQHAPETDWRQELEWANAQLRQREADEWTPPWR